MDLTGWYWIAWVLVLFLPLEIYAASRTPGRADTFSEFVWWAFGIRKNVKFGEIRRLILSGFMYSLSSHLIFGTSATLLIVFGVGCFIVVAYALKYERKRE